ncbi:putative protein kinase UbiB [Planctomycetes bacterium Pan216]|uniref:ABC1 atypical kinase-like domain-containing protein n=1 Tax=Kolteria novifilia TaxID=2527975 RepID=A0A518B247_9BACT|nr:putative protein kinase UbiB [Planctomycetes bacterium Pan216]
MAGSLTRAIDLLRLGGSAWRLRGADEQSVRDSARHALIERMGRLRGLPQKVGQMLSMGESESAEDFRRLTEHAPALPVDVIRSELASAWQQPVQEVLGHLDANGLAASLGQVHRGELVDGTSVAIKVRLPGIDAAVASDLKHLGWLSLPVGGLAGRGFDLAGYREEIVRDLNEELDYRVEAEQQRRSAAFAGRLGFVVVPETIDEFCRENVLVSSWEEGETIDKVVAEWSAAEKRSLGKQLLRLFAASLFDEGWVHADPHAGNYRFRRDGREPKVLLYDHGSIWKPDREHRLALVRLILSTARGADEDPYPLFLKLGFREETLEPMRDRLAPLCRVLFEPLTVEAPYDLRDWRRGERVADILGDDRWNFRISGSPSLVFLMRTFHGLIYYLEQLGEPVNWWWHCRGVLEGLEREAARLPLPMTSRRSTTFGQLASHLHIRVQEEGRTKVKVSLSAGAVEDLSDLLDDDVRRKIRTRGIDLEELVRGVRRSGYAPRTLFELDEPPRHFAVWLE